MLAAGYRPLSDLSRQYKQIYADDPGRLQTDFQEWWSRVKAEVQSTQPDLVVFSGEAMWKPAHLKALRILLAEITEEVRIVVYVRQPSKHFLSLAYQQVKLSSTIGPWERANFRPVIEMFSAEFPVDVVAYDRSSLIDNDIVSDFIARFIPQASGLLDLTATADVNASYSAEAMSIMQAFRLEVRPAEDNFTRPETQPFLRALDRASQTVQCAHPELKQDIAEAIDYSTKDLSWLKENYGVVFSELDYAKVGDVGLFPGFDKKIKVEDICYVDNDKRRRLLMLTMCGLATRLGLGLPP